jgi:hypothetical protein
MASNNRYIDANGDAKRYDQLATPSDHQDIKTNAQAAPTYHSHLNLPSIHKTSPRPSLPRASTPKENAKRNHSSIFHHFFRFEHTTLSSGWVRKPNTLSGWFYFSKGETARRGRCLIRVLLRQSLLQRVFAKTPLLNRWAYSIARKRQCFYGQGSSVYA